MSQSILIVGGSGQIGLEVARILKSEGHKVRVTTSKSVSVNVKDGLEQVHVNLTTGEGLKAAFEGIDRAFFLSPGGYADQYGMVAPLVQEAKRRGLKKVVLMTAMGANAVETSPFRRVEIDLEKSGLHYNIIRPNWFMQNFHTFWIQGIKEFGKIMLPVGDARTSFIDTRDIAAVAAKLLVDDRFNNKDFDLTGPEALTHAEVAKAIGEVTGRNVTFEELAPEILKQGLIAAGLAKDYVEFLLMILGALKAGYAARVTENVRTILGREPRTFQAYAKEHKQLWAQGN